MKMNRIYAIILCAALAGGCFGQRRFTVTALQSPTSDHNAVGWISDDGTTTFGVLLIPNPAYDPTVTDNPQLPVLNQCYVLNNGKITLYPTPGFSCNNNGANKNLQFTGTLFSPMTFPVTAYANLDGSFDIYGAHLPGLDYTQYSSCAPDCAVPLSQSFAINDQGDIVGTVDGYGDIGPKPVGAPRAFVQYSFLFSGGQVIRLPDGFTAFSINNNGDIAGQATTATGINPSWDAAIYRNGNVMRLGTLGGPTANVWKINNKGQAVGYSSLREWDPGDLTSLIGKPFFYDGQNMLPIDVPGALWGASVWALNDAGEAGGTFYGDNDTYCSLNNCHYTQRAFYYANGTAVDLNSLLVNPPDGLVLRSVYYISNSGQILAGTQVDDNRWTPTYLLTPVPEPTVDGSARKAELK